MSLARTALRLAAVAALNADPVIDALCAGRVYDSRINELDSQEPVPLIVVYTEDDQGGAYSANNGGPPFNHTCGLVLELSMRLTVPNDDTGQVDVGLPETDREMEASLDLLEECAINAVTVADTPEARLIRTAVTRRTLDFKSIRFASAETGAKMAMRLITLSTQLKGYEPDLLDPPTGDFAVLPDPLRTVALALDPGSSGYQTCVALAARLSPPAAVPFAGADVTLHPFSQFDPAAPPSLGDPDAPDSMLQQIDIPA